MHVTYCCVTDDPQTEQLKPTNTYHLTVSAGRQSGCDLLGASGSGSLTGVPAISLGSSCLNTGSTSRLTHMVLGRLVPVAVGLRASVPCRVTWASS